MLKDRGAVFVVISVFGVLLLRVFWLQIVQAERYGRLSKENYVKQVIVRAPRGNIYSSEKILLADTRAGYTLYLPPGTTSPFLEETLGIVLDASEDVKIVRDIPFKTVSWIEERGLDISGVEILAEPVRRYYYGNTISHIMGYVGEISKQELERMKGYKAGDLVGKKGIEREYERYLRGDDGVDYIEVDVMGRELGAFSPGRSPIPGADIYLSICIEIQKIAASALSEYKGGAVVAIDPRDGRVLAYYSHPGFNPNHFSPRIDKNIWKELLKDPSLPLFDRAKNGRYPPASLFKLVVAAKGLEDGLIQEDSYMPHPCDEGLQIGRRFFGCWERHEGRLSLIEAIEQSCNVYFYQLGMDIGVDGIADGARSFGLGEETGIDLPGESDALIPDKAWYNAHFGEGRWTWGHVANLSIGQGEILVTPLQMAVFASTIANGGVLYSPTLVDSILSYDGKRLFANRPTGRRVNLTRETLKFLRRAMLGTVERGTGRAAWIEGVGVAGKTGTAQNPHGESHAWFICFAPYENPSVAISIFVEHGGKGGAVAAPIARDILEFLYPTGITGGASCSTLF
ncbi:penicillin-binding protein 2 [candidate division WOR-3 bacterium]|nr:penicillin-binding protein 2 [candidate division WOR-3 bacterium]